MKLITGINTCFNIVISSKTEKDFYMNVYRYFDYIFAHPELAELYDEGGRKYRTVKGDKDNKINIIVS